MPTVQLVSGVTPVPAVAWVRRMLSLDDLGSRSRDSKEPITTVAVHPGRGNPGMELPHRAVLQGRRCSMARAA